MQKLLLLLAVVLLSGTMAFGQKAQTKAPKAPKGATTASFKAYGNCGMCERRIESTVTQIPGVISAEWVAEKEMLSVKYLGKSVSLEDIKKKVAAVGHDTDEFRAPDEVYDKLHGCCKYERPASN
jgi:mercuric ion binding protein